MFEIVLYARNFSGSSATIQEHIANEHQPGCSLWMRIGSFLRLAGKKFEPCPPRSDGHMKNECSHGDNQNAHKTAGRASGERPVLVIL